MKKHKKFCYVVMGFIAGLLVFNAVIWHAFTKRLLTRTGGVIAGDLARMGYLTDHIHPRQNINELPQRHINASDYEGQRIDLVTLGDSFANGGGFGPNRHFQDYIATLQGLNVLNVDPYPGTTNYIETMVVLANSGFLERIQARRVLIEIAERSCVSRFSRSVDFGKSDDLDNILAYYFLDRPPQIRDDAALPPVSFFNTGNLKFVLFNFCYLFSDNAFFSQVYKVRLDRKLFSKKRGDELLFLDRDLEKLKWVTEDSLAKVNENLNDLARILKEKGVDLYFMPAPNKYTLYRKYFVDDEYPKSRFFEIFRELNKDYRFIDAEQILAGKLEKGIKDIYFLDDTHWSWKASRAIFEEFKFE